MADYIDRQYYEIVHPVTGQTEVWQGERINAYEVNYKQKVLKPLSVKKSTRKKRTTKSKTIDNG